MEKVGNCFTAESGFIEREAMWGRGKALSDLLQGERASLFVSFYKYMAVRGTTERGQHLLFDLFDF